jgi:alkanesulfonate monooxygenase SsuD/methylene tetrahydromethanopterin reductase-like flavin-dependent oxidoreductase (luciferase family)
MGSGTAEEIARFAIRAEQTGYHTIWVSDHLLVPDAGDTIPPIEIMDPIPPSAITCISVSPINGPKPAATWSQKNRGLSSMLLR